ncbi:putative manganese-dependent inorganic diphosphatase [Rubrobacter indicoceani]|uniref:putative manganese-dependent inorganic diphosphatase n=1 Tax=Rubrobacter indicoceani TaxID=2051957 RepID=UPI000E5B0C6E|nr:putative manganese-dependent inorganic diphosphatase [Rubrobacter indicoceani]
MERGLAFVYVTGHKNPDTDTVASAIGLAELRNLTDPENDYHPARLGEVNAQTDWALKKSGAKSPKRISHIMLRVKDVMKKELVVARRDDPLRNVGVVMSQRNIGQVPIVDEKGRLAGIITERDLARMYVRESREASSFENSPVWVHLIVEVLEGELLVEGAAKSANGKLWVVSMSEDSMGGQMDAGDVVVVGDRTGPQKRAIELGVSVLVVSNNIRPEKEVLDLARERGVAVVLSPLDSYVTSRLIQLSVPCWEVMSENPLTVEPDTLISDITQPVMEVHYRAAIAIDQDKIPVGVVSRTDLINPDPRRVALVDHAEIGQSIAGVERANVVEILDHHHLGDLETKTPMLATFDPVGSTATLIIERFRGIGLDPEKTTATMLLAAVLSDTVILNSPTTTGRDREVVKYLEEYLDLDAQQFGMEMFEASSDVTDLTAQEITARDAKEYKVGAGETICIAQVETVGKVILERRDELLKTLESTREKEGYLLFALMVTDIIEQGTELLCVGECSIAEYAFDAKAENGAIDLPGVMSRKKQVAPKLLAAF